MPTGQKAVGAIAAVSELTGTAIDEEDMLKFSSLQQIRPMIEPVSLEDAAAPFKKMMRNEASFRMVIKWA